MALETLRDLYVDHIQDLYSSETQILEALPKMIDKASHVKLRDGFAQHLEQTRQHVTRLEQIARRLDEKADAKTCKGMAGVLKEGSEVVKGDGDQDVIDCHSASSTRTRTASPASDGAKPPSADLAARIRADRTSQTGFGRFQGVTLRKTPDGVERNA